MPYKHYRKSNKLKPEDWTKEIEEWEKHYQEPWFIEKRRFSYEDEIREREAKERRMYANFAFLLRKWEEEEQLLLDYDGNFCGHYKKGEMDDGIIVCWDCGRELGRCYGGSVGYNFRNHTMRGRKKK